jgi:outer membrane protein assembly factor BamB
LQFVWAYPAEPPYADEARPMRHAPVVDAAGHICLCCQGRLVALLEEAEKPRVVWEYVVGSHVPGPIVLAPDGTLRLHSADGYLHAVTPDGKQAFVPAHVGQPLGWATPVVDEAGNTWISAYDGGLLRVAPEGKPAVQPFFRSRQKLDSAGIVLDRVLYVGSEDGYLFAIELGEQRGFNRWNHAIDQGYTGGYLNSSPAVSEDGGTIIVASRDEVLFGFAPTGGTAWTTRLPGQMLGSPVVDRHGHLYVGVSQFPRGQEGRGLLVSIDGNSHQIRWQYSAAGPVESTPAIGDDDILYFGDNSGTLHAVDSQGRAVWTAKVEAPVRSAAVILAPQRVAFGLDDDTLVVLRCSSQGLSPNGWPKFRRTLGQSGLAGGSPDTECHHGDTEDMKRRR